MCRLVAVAIQSDLAELRVALETSLSELEQAAHSLHPFERPANVASDLRQMKDGVQKGTAVWDAFVFSGNSRLFGW